MSRVKVVKDFKFAYGGVHVRTHAVGTILDAGDEACAVALEEKWGVTIKEEKPPEETEEPAPGGESPDSGPEKPLSSSPPDRPSSKKK